MREIKDRKDGWLKERRWMGEGPTVHLPSREVIPER